MNMVYNFNRFNNKSCYNLRIVYFDIFAVKLELSHLPSQLDLREILINNMWLDIFLLSAIKYHFRYQIRQIPGFWEIFLSESKYIKYKIHK